VEEVQYRNTREETRVPEQRSDMKEKTSFFADDSFSTGSLPGIPGHDEK
jgi:hypothetical protein